jgi:hypothetical protein
MNFFKKGNLKKKVKLKKDLVKLAIENKIKSPIHKTIFVVVAIVAYYAFGAYQDVSTLEGNRDKVQEGIDKKKQRISKIDNMLLKQKDAIVVAKGTTLDPKQPIMLVNKVCELLKLRDVIGSFYISKKQSKKFKNVLEIDIKISYGDKELMKLIVSILMDKIFYLKDIQIVEKGLKIELFRP